MMTLTQLTQMMIAAGGAKVVCEAAAPHLFAALERYDLDDALEVAAMVGQFAHESSGFIAKRENLNYTAERLVQVWPSRFGLPGAVLDAGRNLSNGKANARWYAGKPVNIANAAYANRIGNGAESSGDGYLYRGGGWIQITGRANYRAAAEATGYPLERDPDLITHNDVSAAVSVWYWVTHGLGKLVGNVPAQTVKINGGTTGLEDRIARIKAAESVA